MPEKAQGLDFGLELLFQPKPLYVLGEASYIGAIVVVISFVAPAGFELTIFTKLPPASASQVLQLKAWATIPGVTSSFPPGLRTELGDSFFLGIALPLSHIPRFNITFCWRVL